MITLLIALITPSDAQRVEPTSTGNQTADVLFINAESAWFNNKANDCVTILQQIATNYAGTKAGLRAQVALARIEHASGNTTSAQDRLTAVLSVATTDRGLRAEIARAQYEKAWSSLLTTQPDYATAITEFQKLATYADASERDQDESSVVEKAEWQMAHCLLAQKQTTAAITAFRTFITNHPNCYLSIRAQEKLESLGVMAASPATNPVIIADTRDPDPNCGPIALAAVIKEMGMLERSGNPGSSGQSSIGSLFGNKTELSDDELIKHLIRMCNVDAKQGTSFEHLKDAAAKVWLHARGYRLDLPTLKAILVGSVDRGVIAWVNRNHFIALVGTDGNMVKICDPAGLWDAKNGTRNKQERVGKVPFAELEKMWAGGPDTLGNGYALVIWKHGDSDPVVAAQKKIEGPKKLAKNLGMAFLLVLGCVIPASTIGYPLSASLGTTRIRRGLRRRLGRLLTRFTALGLLCMFLCLGFIKPAGAIVTQQSKLGSQYVPEYPVVRELTKVEMEQITGTQAGAAPSWQGSTSLFNCSSCGSGCVGGTPSAAGNSSGGNFFAANRLMQGGGLVLPAAVTVYLSSQDTTSYIPNAPALKTNFHMKIIGAIAAVNTGPGTTTADVIEEDGTKYTFTKNGDGTWSPPAGHHETLTPRTHSSMMGTVFDGWTLKRPNQVVLTYDWVGNSGANPPDWTNRLANIKDPNNNTVSVAYAASTGTKITSVTDPVNRQITWTYGTMMNPNANLVTITDWASRVVKLDNQTTNVYKIIDALNNTVTINVSPFGSPNPTGYLVSSVQDALGNTTSFGYDQSQSVPPITSTTNPGMGAGGKSIAYGTDGQGNKTTTITDEEGHKRRETYHATSKDLLKIEVEFTAGTWTTVETRTYDGDHNVLSRTNGLNKTWDMTWDTRGNPLTLTHPSVGGAPRAQITQTFDTKNNRLTITNELGKQWKWEYDTSSRMTSDQDPVQAAQMPPVKTTYTYNADGTRATMTNALGKVWQYFYDANKNLTSEKDPLLNETKYGYDSLARRIWIQLPENVPNGPKTEFTFDNNDRVTQVTNPDATFRTTTYNCCVKTEDKDENNKRTQYEYNQQNCLIKVWAADDPNKTGTPILLEYYLDGQLKSVTDRKNQKTTLTYDGGHRQTKITYADTTKFEEFTFNAASQLTSRKKQDGNIINYTYDERGRRTGIDYPTGTDPTFTLDNASRRTQMVDGTGTYNYTYSDRDETLSVTYPGGKVVSYTFDVAGQRTKRTLTSYGDTTYLYNDAGGISSFTTPDAKTFSYTYNKNGAVTQQTNGNTSKAIYTYNNRLFLTNLSNQKSDNTVISSFAYTTDNVGNPLRVTENDNTYSDWFYDDLYQLTRETKRNIVGAQDTRGSYVDDTAQTDLSYVYDLAHNRSSMTNNLTSSTTNYTYNNMNQMLTAGNITFTYDGNGSTATKVVSMQTTTYTWDFENKLKQIDYPGGSNNTFATNADGKRITANDSDGNRRFLYDGARLVGEEDISSGSLTATYDHGLAGLLARQTRGSSARYHHFDGIYSTRQLSDSSQVVTDTVSFDAWGNLLASSGTTFYPHKYVGGMGYYWSSQSGLDLLGARYYSPSTGRFVSQDPSRDGLNWYGYTNNRPSFAVDPNGRFSPAIPLVVLCGTPPALVACALFAAAATIVIFSALALGADFVVHQYAMEQGKTMENRRPKVMAATAAGAVPRLCVLVDGPVKTYDFDEGTEYWQCKYKCLDGRSFEFYNFVGPWCPLVMPAPGDPGRG